MGNEKLYFFLDKYKSEIKNLVQVGAHYGQEIEFFLKTNYKNILLFEPNEKAVQVLEKKCINMSNVKIYPFALGSKNTESLMYYSNENDGQSSSFLKPALHKKVQSSITFNDQKKITVKKFEDLEISDIDFLLMDVQGFELEVLKGFGNELNLVKFIFTEVNRDYLYENNVLIYDLDRFLKSKDFIRVWTSWRTADMPWGDAFYIKTNKIGKFKIKLLLIKNILTTNKVFFLLYFIFDFRVNKKRVKKLIKNK